MEILTAQVFHGPGANARDQNAAEDKYTVKKIHRVPTVSTCVKRVYRRKR